MNNNDYDIVIVGAGLVGLLLACALSDSRLKIAVLDQKGPPNDAHTDRPDLRVSAITLASQKILLNLGVWPRIPAERISPFRKMHVWDAAGTGEISFDSAEVGKQTLGAIIENKVLQKALLEQLKTHDNIEFIYPAQLIGIESNLENITLALSNHMQLTTRLLLGADGAESQVRKLANIEMKQWDYGQNALVCNVKTTLSHQQTAWQRFLPDGILAFLPLANSQECSIVWSTEPQEAQRLLALETADFKSALTAAFEKRMGEITDVSERLSFPLQMRHAKQYALKHIALVGDAAHTIHPLAGQGVNLGFLDAATLAEIILAALKRKQQFDSQMTLRRYERWRKSENMLMLGVVETIKQLFEKQTVPLQMLRNLGMNMTDNIAPVKNYLAKRAMGLVGDLPEIAK